MSNSVIPGKIQQSHLLQQNNVPAKTVAGIDHSKVDPKLLKAAQGMESLFLDYMMSVMRKSIPKSKQGLNNAATKIYQNMLDSEYAKTAARTGGIGLADQIIAYLGTTRYNLRRSKVGSPGQKENLDQHSKKRLSTGGVHEDRRISSQSDKK